MDVIIDQETIWGTSTGIFECIVDGTRSLFRDSELRCEKEIFASVDHFQQFLALDELDEECFNLFYSHCKKAMEEFPSSETGKSVPQEGMPVILVNWSELLRIMREDPRYRGQQEIPEP